MMEFWNDLIFAGDFVLLSQLIGANSNIPPSIYTVTSKSKELHLVFSLNVCHCLQLLFSLLKINGL
jgi:hypothetical protein